MVLNALLKSMNAILIRLFVFSKCWSILFSMCSNASSTPQLDSWNNFWNGNAVSAASYRSSALSVRAAQSVDSKQSWRPSVVSGVQL